MYLSLQTHHLRHVLQHSVILINKIDAVCRRMPPQTAPWLTQMGSLYAQNAAHVLTAAPVGLQTLISIWERSLVRKQKKNVILLCLHVPPAAACSPLAHQSSGPSLPYEHLS